MTDINQRVAEAMIQGKAEYLAEYVTSLDLSDSSVAHKLLDALQTFKPRILAIISSRRCLRILEESKRRGSEARRLHETIMAIPHFTREQDESLNTARNEYRERVVAEYEATLAAEKAKVEDQIDNLILMIKVYMSK